MYKRQATARPVQDGNNQTYRLTNGLRGSNKQSDFEWCGWYDEDATFTIDLGKTEAINEITIGCITNYGMGAHIPGRITSVSYTHLDVYKRQELKYYFRYGHSLY